MTMHKLESVEKLIHQFEEMAVENPFIYKDFNYSLKEYDNIPEVIPRFQFYLQNCLKPIVAYCKTMKDGL
jgi:hypothetical protein